MSAPPPNDAAQQESENRGYGEKLCRRCDVQAAFCPCEKPDVAMDIVEFIEARLAEDEAVARSVRQGVSLGGQLWVIDDDHRHNTIGISTDRVLRAVEVKRRMVTAHEGEHYCPTTDGDSPYFNYMAGWAEEKDHPQICPVHRLLAFEHSDHPDYRQEWAP